MISLTSLQATRAATQKPIDRLKAKINQRSEACGTTDKDARMDINNFQRIGATSNTEAGRDFEAAAHIFFQESGIKLFRGFPALVGFRKKKEHLFDLGSEDPPILVECKSYTWTSGGNSPSAKIRGMNEAMLLFSVAPPHYRKILFLLKHLHEKTRVSLAMHYIKNHEHLFAPGVEVWEFDLDTKEGVPLLK